MAVDSQGNLFAANFSSGTISEVPTSGVDAGSVSTYVTGLDEPTGVTLSPGGTLYVAEAVGSIYTVTSGTATLFASLAENPTGMAFDSQSNLYVSGLSNGDIYVYPQAGGGPNTFATGFSDPEGLVFNTAGDLLVADLGNSNGAGSSSSEITLLESNGQFDENITGFTDPAYIVDLSGTSTVTPSAGANGAIVPGTPQAVSSGSSIGFTATPDSGYAVNQWLLNGTVAQTGGDTFTVTNATPNDTVVVTFKASGPITPFPGAYEGLLADDSGYVTINLSANGRFTGNAIIGADSHTFSGLFSSLGAAQATVSGNAGSISLQLGIGQSGIPGTYSITGSANGTTVISQ
jgi:sugar lactone lactonase YvrE